MTRLLTLLLAVVLLLDSCRSRDPLAEYGAVVEDVLRNDSATFRGFNLGDPMEKVMSAESKTAAEADDGYLYYELQGPSGVTYSIAYDFDEQHLLKEVQADIFIPEAAQTDSLLSLFRRYFSHRFGLSEQHGGFDVWTVPSEEDSSVRVNLSDESADIAAGGGPGKIAIWIYREEA